MNNSLERAEALFEQDRFQQSADETRRVLAIEPDNAHAHARLAACLAELRQFGDAAEEANWGVAISPEDDWCSYIQAFVLSRKGNYLLAEQSCLRAISLNPMRSSYFAQLSMIKQNMGSWHRGLQAAERGLEINPLDQQCANFRSRCLSALGKNNEAIDASLESLANDPTNVQSVCAYGYNLMSTGQYRKAEEQFRVALRLAPQNEYAKSGMLQALQARNPIYALILGYFALLKRLPKPVRRYSIVAIYLVARALMAAPPGGGLTRFIGFTLAGVYIIVLASSWLASPTSNFFLGFNEFGRCLLTPRQVLGPRLMAIGELGTIVSIVVCIFTQRYGWLAIGLAVVSTCVFAFYAKFASSRRAQLICLIAAIACGILISSFGVWCGLIPGYWSNTLS